MPAGTLLAADPTTGHAITLSIRRHTDSGALSRGTHADSSCTEAAGSLPRCGFPLDTGCGASVAIALHCPAVGGCEKDISTSLTEFPRGEFMKVQVHNLLPDRIKRVSGLKKRI